MRRLSFCLFAVLLLLFPNAGFAAGKAGLWAVTTTHQFATAFVPPALVALSRAQNLKPPVTGKPFTHHICMTRYEADGRQPLHLNSYDLDWPGWSLGAARACNWKASVMAPEASAVPAPLARQDILTAV